MGVGGEVAPDTNKIFMEETNMKKIIATVLAMVMALALCTTAFAVSSVYAGAEVGTDTIKRKHSIKNKICNLIVNLYLIPCIKGKEQH